MSPLRLERDGLIPGFPRVSGDEPADAPDMWPPQKFSPRERG